LPLPSAIEGANHCVVSGKSSLAYAYVEDFPMTSPTDITNRRRAAKLSKRGTPRKNQVRLKGTTPALFLLNKPTANEKK
jgi:hypothetical protein